MDTETKDDRKTREQGQFLATVSHEIRTPLNAISGMSQLLADTNMDATQREFVDVIVKAGSHLLTMVDNLLDVAKYQSDSLELVEDTLDVVDELKAAIADINNVVEEKKLSITIQCTPDVSGHKILDRKRFRQCLNNLLGNAVKFTKKGKIKISIWTVQPDETHGKVFVSITDSGPGIDVPDLEPVFDLFHQQNDEFKRSFDGAGLGLPVTRMLAEKMGGGVEAVSTMGVGSTFTLSVDYALPQLEAAAGDGKTSTGHILVVEDNRTNQRLIQLVLEKLGHSSMLAFDGQQAVDSFATEHFDLILMDLHMPVMDGFEAAQKIRASGHANANLPIIALTADVRAGIEDKIEHAGMDAYLSKPFEVPVLAATIDACLQEAVIRRKHKVDVSPSVRIQSG